MISSLTSGFNLGGRRALFVSADKAAVYHWFRNDLGSSYLFDLSHEGRRNFRRYLAETAKSPFYVLVDVFEEEYKPDTIPHVGAADRAAIIRRRVSRLFGDPRYYFYRLTGREKKGRRDDRVLLAAITDAKAIKPWIDMLVEAKAPLAGIYSLSLLTESVLKHIEKETPRHKLIVSLQSISGLRQTFFYDGEFQISRLVRLPRYGTVSYAPYIRDEIDKIYRYLNSLRLMRRDEPLHVYFIFLNDELLDILKADYSSDALRQYHFCDVNELLANSGSARTSSTPYSDLFFIHHLLRSKPENMYALSDERRYFSMRRWRYSMLAAGLLLLIAGVIGSGAYFVQGVNYRQQGLAAQKKTQFYTARYELAREGLPELPVAAADLKVAVDIVTTLEKYTSSPLDMVRLLSASLERFPVIQIANMDWAAGADPNLNSNAADAQTNAAGSTGIDYGDQSAYQYYQIAVLEGRIHPFDGDYRQAIKTINEFAEDIRVRDGVYEVRIVTLPLDVSSKANLQGDTQVEDDIAAFTFRVVLGMEHEI